MAKYGAFKYGSEVKYWGFYCISDRTLSDVSYAKSNQSNAGYNKGALNLAYDLNRIESNCSYLASQLNYFGYSVSITTKTDWVETDFPFLAEINRVRNNIDTLLDIFYRMPDSPEIRYVNTLDWQDANSLEQNLLNMYSLLQRMVAVFLRCGDAYGGDI